ncbi:S1C family serine protease [Rhodococcoides yunnanense]|uniref:S1C family serine protease n=1 Tax=Rhodococcoides yunnanense TaxID=278209 RepID=UPI0009355E20|nr:trypsin-like peptidase domain-containing protein [Rhodococcus yunnanensis]
MTTTARRASAAALATIAGAALLSACSFSIGTGGDTDAESGGGVDFTGLQSATIQLEAFGTFVSPQEGGYEAAGRGSGFLISSDGYALTNNHVVTGAGTLKVWRGGDQSEQLNARVVGSSECLDLAVVKLDGSDFPYVSYHEGSIDTADEIYAAGFPLGDPTFTMTKGIVSKADTKGDTPWASLDHVIEHDAKIRGGNSGGPLVDPDGRLVGVNYAGNDKYDTNMAIHRDEVQKVVEDLKNGRNVLSLGINGEALTDDDGTGLGVWVNSVASGSAADKAGVEPGDLLTSMEGVTLGADGTMAEYCSVLRTHGQDATLSVEVYRPATDSYLRGQFNGDAIEETTTVSSRVSGSSNGGSVSQTSTGGFTTVEDNEGVVTVDVPAAWNQVDGTKFVDDRGNSFYGVEASSNLDQYQGGWGAVGTSVMASDTAVGNSSPEDLLNWATATLPQAGCVSTGREDYSDALHTGRFEVWTGCGETAATYIVVAAQADSGRYLTLVAVQANSDADLDAADRVMNSFTVTL